MVKKEFIVIGPIYWLIYLNQFFYYWIIGPKNQKNATKAQAEENGACTWVLCQNARVLDQTGSNPIRIRSCSPSSTLEWNLSGLIWNGASIDNPTKSSAISSNNHATETQSNLNQTKMNQSQILEQIIQIFTKNCLNQLQLIYISINLKANLNQI